MIKMICGDIWAKGECMKGFRYVSVHLSIQVEMHVTLVLDYTYHYLTARLPFARRYESKKSNSIRSLKRRVKP